MTDLRLTRWCTCRERAKKKDLTGIIRMIPGGNLTIHITPRGTSASCDA